MILIWWLFLFLVVENYACFCLKRSRDFILVDKEDEKDLDINQTIKASELEPKADAFNVDATY